MTVILHSLLTYGVVSVGKQMIKLLGDVMTGLKSRKRMKNTNFWREKLGNMKDISECGTGCCLNFEDWQIWRSQGWIDLKR